jgi:hypothetical protein
MSVKISMDLAQLFAAWLLASETSLLVLVMDGWTDFVPVNSQPILHLAGDLRGTLNLIFSFGLQTGDKSGF